MIQNQFVKSLMSNNINRDLCNQENNADVTPN